MLCLAIILLVGGRAAAAPAPQSASEISVAWSAAGGRATLALDAEALRSLNLAAPAGELSFAISPGASTFQLRLRDGQPASAAGSLFTRGQSTLDVNLAAFSGPCRFGDFEFNVTGRRLEVIDGLGSSWAVFESAPGSVMVDFDERSQTISITAALVLSPGFSERLLVPGGGVAAPIGTLTVVTPADMIDFDEHEADASTEATPRAGADVIVGGLTGDAAAGAPQSYGLESGIAAYAIGTTSCNLGTVPLKWRFGIPSEHPVISQNLYRLKTEPGTAYQRFEHVGQSWLKHGFCALQESLCTTCSPFGDCCCNHLGVGCSDPYTASRNGSFVNLGPKSEVNPADGTFPWPHAAPSGDADIRGRLQAATGDVDPDENAGALYYVEGQYIAADDAAAGNDNNNASYRRVNINNNANFTMSWVGGNGTVREKAGIYAWQANDGNVVIIEIDVPSDGRMTLAYRVTDIGGGRHHYEYALYNMNSDRGAQSFTVNLTGCADVTETGFHDVFYHSGEPYDGTDWTPAVLSGQVSWATETEDENADANALRFGTLYNFRFDAATAPVAGTIEIGLFKDGSPGSVVVSAMVPDALGCIKADVTGNGLINGGDIARFTEILVDGGGTALETCAGDVALVPDCAIGLDDVGDFVGCLLGGGCP